MLAETDSVSLIKICWHGVHVVAVTASVLCVLVVYRVSSMMILITLSCVFYVAYDVV